MTIDDIKVDAFDHIQALKQEHLDMLGDFAEHLDVSMVYSTIVREVQTIVPTDGRVIRGTCVRYTLRRANGDRVPLFMLAIVRTHGKAQCLIKHKTLIKT